MSPIGPIVVATGNKNKLAELRTIAADYSLELLSPAECRERYALGPWPEVEEDAPTFIGNARNKAEAFAAWSKIAALGDDSGLEVDALGGAPGVRSARYAGEGASDRDRMEKVLRELAEVEKENPKVDRRGRFRCALSLVRPDGAKVEAEGALDGEILREPRGDKGFGYDPIIHLDDIGATLAEVDFSRTCREGFRAKAAKKLFELLVSSAPAK